jgi:hypothetical protein
VIRLKVLSKGTKVIDDVLDARRNYLATILAEIDLADKERLIHALEQLNYLMTREV